MIPESNSESPPPGRWLGGSHLPRCLREIPDPPTALCVRGRFDELPPAIAVVGSRRATPRGLRSAFSLGRDLASAGILVVSGLARGIDAAALAGAVAAEGRGGAVLGSGIDRIYPQENHRLAENLIAHGGFVATEFAESTPPRKHHFPRRNRLISGLSIAVVVVEAALRSGSLITARCALEQGREVCAFPGPVDAPQSEGCHALIQDGAALVTGAEDLISWLGREFPQS